MTLGHIHRDLTGSQVVLEEVGMWRTAGAGAIFFNRASFLERKKSSKIALIALFCPLFLLAVCYHNESKATWEQ